jgi:hypothetical protein
MLGDEHLHIDQEDRLSDWMSRAAKCAKGGAIAINFEGQPAVRIVADNGRIAIDILQAGIFKVPEDETGLFDKLKTASEFGRKLSDNGVTLSFMRKGKEAIRLGKDARPTFSKLVSGSDDIQLTSVKEFAKLKGDLKTD